MDSKEKTSTEIIEESYKAIEQEALVFDVIRRKPKLWQKKKKSFSIKPLTLGVMNQITRELNKVELSEKDMNTNVVDLGVDQINKYLDNYLRILAYAIQGGKRKPAKGLLRFLRWNIDSKEMFQLTTGIVSLMDTKDFCSSIILTRGMSLMNQGD